MLWLCLFFILGPSGLASQGCSRALDVVRNVREHLRGRIVGEQKTNFAPYKIGKKRKIGLPAFTPPVKKCSPWSARFVCLANTDDQHVPCTIAPKEVLINAGLGEQKVDIPDIECSAEVFRQHLIKAFPKLEDAGGFELMRCLANSKFLETLSSHIAMSPHLLRKVVGKSRIFIRPLQRDLDIDTPENDKLPAKVCL